MKSRLCRLLILTMLTPIFAHIDAAHADSKSPNKPRISQRGDLLISDDFSSGTIDKPWRVTVKNFSVQRQALVGEQVKGNGYGATIIGRCVAQDAIVECSVKLFRSKGLTVSLVGRSPNGETLTRARVVIRSNVIELYDYQTSISKEYISLSPSKLYRVMLEVQGDKAVFHVNGKPVISGKAPGFSYPKKAARFAVTAGPGLIDDITVHAASPLSK